MMKQVAVYGSLRQDMGNHRILKGSAHRGTQVAQLPGYMVSLGSYPGLIRDGVIRPITLEVYEVSDCTFNRLDQLEGHPRFYKRELIPTDFGEAWVYWLQQSRDETLTVESGDWVQHQKEGGRNDYL